MFCNSNSPFKFRTTKVIVHAAIRTKVPLKKKVRGERSKTKRSSGVKNADSSSKNVDKSATLGAAAIAATTTATAPATTTVATAGTSSKSRTLSRSIAKHTKKMKSRKPSDSAHLESKTSKNPLASTMAKVKSSKSKSKLKSSTKAKDILNYTKRSSVDDDKVNSFGKVQQWLLESPTQAATSALQELDQLDKTRPICKSQSQTHNLTATQQRSPKKVKSLSNLQEKVKLQVVYKPPFKLSLKLSSNSAVQTRVVNPNPGETSRNRRAARVDKNRKLSTLNEKKKPRTALLLQSKSGRDTDDIGFRLKSNHRRTEDRQQLMPTERKQEALEVKGEQSSSNMNRGAIINDEKVFSIGKLINGSSSSPVNTDTFKISKTSSGTKLLSNSINALNEIDNPPSSSLPIGNECKLNGHRSSFINNFRNSNNGGGGGSSSGGSDHGNFAPNRSSTSNLTKDKHKITRSSTTNLSKNQTHRNSFDVNHSTHNFSKDRFNETHSNLLKQQPSSKTNLNISENGSLPSSAVSSTSSTNANANANANVNANLNINPLDMNRAT